MASWFSRLFRRGQHSRTPKAGTRSSSPDPAAGATPPKPVADSGPSPRQGDSLENDLVAMRQALQAQGFPEEAIEGMCRQLEEEVIAMAERQARQKNAQEPADPTQDRQADAESSSKDTQHEQPDP